MVYSRFHRTNDPSFSRHHKRHSKKRVHLEMWVIVNGFEHQ